MDEYKEEVHGYEINGYDVHTYCKTNEIGKKDKYICSIFFGTAMKKFCITAKYTHMKPDEIYIDRIEQHNECILNTSLEKVLSGTIKLVKLCLFTLKTMFPNVKYYRFMDDSKIYCDGEKSGNMMSMAYDYILKYNKTWYQTHFHATLPQESIKIYTDSLAVLDEPIEPSPTKELLDGMEPYMDIYRVSSTPREFMNALRKQLKDNYCKEVGKWLTRYMIYIRIKLKQDEWYIPADKITKPDGYSIHQMDNATAHRKLHGGYRNTRKRSTDKRITKSSRSTSHRKKTSTIGIVSREDVRYIMGAYKDFM